VAVWQSS